jgi:dissimilatory sulfite reductase (desulfoviridin) alpha/beta subunit
VRSANNAPVYASIYSELAEHVRAHGYALCVHGSLARDLDAVAVPWAEVVSDPDEVVKSITERWALICLKPADKRNHGRVAYTLIFRWGTSHIDLSFMPAAAALSGGEEKK